MTERQMPGDGAAPMPRIPFGHVTRSRFAGWLRRAANRVDPPNVMIDTPVGLIGMRPEHAAKCRGVRWSIESDGAGGNFVGYGPDA